MTRSFSFLFYFIFIAPSLITFFSPRGIFVGAFSISWVYEDLLAHPRYKVSISSILVANSSLEGLISENEEEKSYDTQETSDAVLSVAQFTTPPENQEGAKPSYIVMRNSAGQRYLCLIPLITNDTNIDEEKQETYKSDVEILKKGLELLEPMNSNCIYFYSGTGWWTYEYCHLRHIRQYHQITEAGMAPAEDYATGSYYLGRYDPKYATLPSSDKVGKSGQQQQPLGTDLQVSGEKKYLVLRWSDGTTCDLTGKPRRVEIQFHCQLQARDSIASIQETSTCYYKVVVHTPRLCDHPAFLSTSSSKVNDIECNPVVSDAYYEIAVSEQQKLESGPDKKDENSLFGNKIDMTNPTDAKLQDQKIDETESNLYGQKISSEPSEPNIDKGKGAEEMTNQSDDALDDEITNVAEQIFERWREEMRNLGNKAGLDLADIVIEEEDDKDDQSARNFRKVKIFFYDENGQLTQVDNPQELTQKMRKRESSADEEEELSESGRKDFQTLENLINEANKVGFTTDSRKAKKDEKETTDQERLSKLYKTVYESDKRHYKKGNDREESHNERDRGE